MKTYHSVLMAVLGLITSSFLSGEASWAGGKKPSTDPGAGNCTPHQPILPSYRVILQPVQTKPFRLPNGVTVDLQQELNAIFNTAVTETSVFSPFEPGSDGSPCDNWIEIRAAVSTFQMDVTKLGIRFGYTPAGSSVPGQTAEGQVDVSFGTVAMEFSVWEHTPEGFQAVVAKSASSTTTDITGSFKLNFGTIQTGADFAHHPAVQNAIRKIMNAGLDQASKSARLSELTWKATVREVIPEAGTLIFDKGIDTRVSLNQHFVVYAVTDATGVCNVFKPVAEVSASRVDPISTQAVIVQQFDPRGIQVGDVIMLKPLPKQQ